MSPVRPGVGRLTCNEDIGGSNPSLGSIKLKLLQLLLKRQLQLFTYENKLKQLSIWKLQLAASKNICIQKVPNVI